MSGILMKLLENNCGIYPRGIGFNWYDMYLG